jgi:hypothetical protein
MDELIVCLNNNNGLFSLIFSFLVTLSTIVYAVLTGFLVNETIKLRKVQTEPKIQIILESHETFINSIRLNVKNIGQGPALNIIFEPSVISGGKKGEDVLHEFSSVKAFLSGLNYFGPSHSFYTKDFDILEKEKEKIFDIVIKIETKYESITKQKYHDIIIIDFRELEGSYRIGKPNLYSIAQSLEKIEKTLHNITSGFRKIHVDTYDSVDRQIQKDKNNSDEEEIQEKQFQME